MADKGTYYITTPIYYPSANAHIGHCYTTVAADTMARFKKLCGYDTYFLTGSDEHGQKIERKAAEKGVTPQQFVDEIVANFKKLWELMEIDYDDFIRTTDKRHEVIVQKIFRQLYEQGDIYKGEYEGWYCTPCEAHWTETQLKEGHICPDCGRPVERVREEAYFFKTSKYQDWLIQYIEEHPDFIQPASRATEMLSNFLRPGLQDLCVTRTSFKWGIPVDFDPKHVIYVWLDALSNYITALGWGSEDDSLYRKYWPANVHLIGKEIVRFHVIYWPIMLHALGLPLPKQVFGHGWLVFGGEKMSKSKGNVVDPNDVVDEFGADVLRTYTLFMGDYASAAPWSETSVRGCKRFIERFAALDEYIVPEKKDALVRLLHKTVKKVGADIEAMKFNTAIAAMMIYINEVYASGGLDRESLSVLTRLLCPFAPHICEEMWERIGGKGFCSVAEWPAYDEALTQDDEKEIAVQVCGKLRGVIKIPAGSDEDTVWELICADESFKPFIEGKTIIKKIYVRDRLFNIVAK